MSASAKGSSHSPPTAGERRRSARRQLRKPVTVSLAGCEARGGFTCEGRMLNATEHGIACRAPVSRVEGPWVIGDTLRVSFALAEGEQPFDMLARVTNVTAAGTPDHVVLGMEFVLHGKEAGERTRLQAALDAVPANGGGRRAQ